MTHILTEILLLLLVFFVLGCILGCIARRTFGKSAGTASRPTARPPSAGAAPESDTVPDSAVDASQPRQAMKPEETEPAGPPTPSKPRGIPKPRAGGADNLKRIKGVGPVLETKLNALGIHHFSQVARWSPSHVAWVDQELNTRGRIERDDWVAQARRLDEEKS